MRLDIKPGKYILAVSGGVDSMVLLHLLAKKPGIKLVVAHFNHGIRSDSDKDERLVAKMAQKYGLKFEVGRGNLGKKASEAAARVARYKFLEKIRQKHRAESIIAAHHQDDLIETVLINLIRGTGRRGLSSIKNSKIDRPLLSVTKVQIINYAKSNNINWREDSTNQDTKHLRNYIRQKITPKLDASTRKMLVENLDKVANLNNVIDKEIATLSHINLLDIDRYFYAQMLTPVAEEYLTAWLRYHRLADFDSKTIKRLSTAIKTGNPGDLQPISKGWNLRLGKEKASLVRP